MYAEKEKKESMSNKEKEGVKLKHWKEEISYVPLQ